jgi:hypothetical protein
MQMAVHCTRRTPRCIWTLLGSPLVLTSKLYATAMHIVVEINNFHKNFQSSLYFTDLPFPGFLKPFLPAFHSAICAHYSLSIYCMSCVSNQHRHHVQIGVACMARRW